MECCFCSKEIFGDEGHNPDPLNTDSSAVCCSDCNTVLVSPVRRVLWKKYGVSNNYTNLSMDDLYGCIKGVYNEVLIRLLENTLHKLGD